MGFKEMVDYENLKRCGLECCKDGGWKTSIKNFKMKIVMHAATAREELLNGTYRPSPTHDFVLSERGKTREIKAHLVYDRMIYKAFCKYELWPAVTPLIIKNNFASQEGKGTEFAIKQFRQDLTHARRVVNSNHFYVCTFDYHNYFGSIDHQKSYDLIAPRLSCLASRNLLLLYLEIFLDKDLRKQKMKQYRDISFLNKAFGEDFISVGIGIGGEPSQVIAVVYPSYIDRNISCRENVLGYGRYMDDSYAIVRTKEEAKELQKDFIQLSKDLNLEINPKHTQIFNMEKDSVTFLKKRTHLTDSGKIIMELTRKNVNDEIKRLKYYKKIYDKGKIKMKYVIDTLHCWVNYAIRYNSYQSIIYVFHQFYKIFGITVEQANSIPYPKKKFDYFIGDDD